MGGRVDILISVLSHLDVILSPPKNGRNRRSHARSHFLPRFVRGFSRLELEDRCLRLLIGGGYGGSLGPTTFDDAFSPLGVDPVGFTFWSGSSSLSLISTHCRAVRSVELSPIVQPAGALRVPSGTDCSQAMSAGEMNTPACCAIARTSTTNPRHHRDF